MATRTDWEVQIGDQAAWGAADAPTVYLAGIESVSMPNSLVTERQQLLRGIMGTGKNIVAPRYEARGITITGQLIYEQIMYYLDGLAEDAVPVGGAAPYTYTYDGPTTTWVTPRYQTLVCGNSLAIYGLTSAVLESLSFSWQWGEIVQMTSTWMGSSVDDDTLAALTEPTDANTTEATGCHALLYIDAVADTYGDTQVVEMLSGTLDITPNREFLRYAGTCYPSGVYDKSGWDVTGALSIQLTAAMATLADLVVGAITRRKIRIQFTNAVVGAGQRELLVDIYAEVLVEELFTDNDDLVTADLSFRAVQDEAAADIYLTIAAYNATAAAY